MVIKERIFQGAVMAHFLPCGGISKILNMLHLYGDFFVCFQQADDTRNLYSNMPNVLVLQLIARKRKNNNRNCSLS